MATFVPGFSKLNKASTRFTGIDQRLYRVLNAFFASKYHEFGDTLIVQGTGSYVSSVVQVYVGIKAGLPVTGFPERIANLHFEGANTSSDTSVAQIDIFNNAAATTHSSGINFTTGDAASNGGSIIFKTSGTAGTITNAIKIDRTEAIYFYYPVYFVAGSTSIPSFRIQTGVAPTSPATGDVYADGTDVFYRRSDATWEAMTTAPAGSGTELQYRSSATNMGAVTSSSFAAGLLTLPSTSISKASFGAQTELTIATGAITATRSYHSVDTEADAITDDLDTISGGSEGDLLIIRANNSARTVVAKDGTGNLALAGDFTMDNAQDTLTMIYDGASWLELSRSDNGA